MDTTEPTNAEVQTPAAEASPDMARLMRLPVREREQVLLRTIRQKRILAPDVADLSAQLLKELRDERESAGGKRHKPGRAPHVLNMV